MIAMACSAEMHRIPALPKATRQVGHLVRLLLLPSVVLRKPDLSGDRVKPPFQEQHRQQNRRSTLEFVVVVVIDGGGVGWDGGSRECGEVMYTFADNGPLKYPTVFFDTSSTAAHHSTPTGR